MTYTMDERRRDETPRSARQIFSARQRWLLLGAFILLVALRLPHAWAHGRFVDEEGTVFFAYAWHHNWADALLRPFGGYLNIAANAVTLAVARLVQSGIVPLEKAPYCTMTTALAAQTLPAILILTGRAAWLGHRLAVIATLLIIVIAPGTEEVFLNAMHIQFHMALCAALILALDTPTRTTARLGYGALLFAAPLCGPAVIAFLPLFALRALIDRDRSRFEQCAAFAAGAAVQMLLFYGSSPARGHPAGFMTLSAGLLVRLIVMPLLSFGKANDLGVAIYQAQESGGSSWIWIAVLGIILFGALIAVAAKRRDAAPWLVLSALLIAVASFGYGMIISSPRDYFSVGAGERYNFLPIVLLGIATVVLAMRPEPWSRRLFSVLSIMVMITGFTRYARPTSEIGKGPSWAAEVAAWRRDHRHPLAVWPRPFSVDLSDEARPCSPIGPHPELSTDPRYCESGWLGGYYRSKQAQRPMQ